MLPSAPGASNRLVTVPPTVVMYYVAGIFRNNKFRRLPVVKGGKIVGAITRFDLLREKRTVQSDASEN